MGWIRLVQGGGRWSAVVKLWDSKSQGISSGAECAGSFSKRTLFHAGGYFVKIFSL
jgi:hypothetical protein